MTIDSFKGLHAFLSNFYPSQIAFGGLSYATVEHAFQAAKSSERSVQAWIASAPSPSIAKVRGRQCLKREDWDDIKLGVMLWCLRWKFNIPTLRDQLLATGDAQLIEGNTWNDRYWGVCRGVGENHLGRLLMQVREERRAK